MAHHPSLFFVFSLFLLFGPDASADKLVITKAMAAKCASFKGQKDKFQNCLIKNGAGVKKDAKDSKPKAAQETKDKKKSERQSKDNKAAQAQSKPASSRQAEQPPPAQQPPQETENKNANSRRENNRNRGKEQGSRYANLKPIVVAEVTKELFTGGDDGKCYHVASAQTFCGQTICLVWQKSNTHPAPSEDKIKKAIHLLESYVTFGMAVMNYQPSLYPSYTDRITTGSEGKERQWTIELADYLCGQYGGATTNGHPWNGLPKDLMAKLFDTVDDPQPTMQQVALYEIGRSLYNVEKLDEILDWEMDSKDRYGFWTLGFNGALTVLAPEALNLKMDYEGYDNDLERFRRDRLKDIQTYIDNPQWNFDNAWKVWLLPWAPNQSINDMMSGLIILMTDRFGGIPFLTELTKNLLKQPRTPRRTDREQRATNFYNAAKLAAKNTGGSVAKIEEFFKRTLRWTFLP